MNEKDLETIDLRTSLENKTETLTVENQIEKKFSLDDFKIDLTTKISSPTRKPSVTSQTKDLPDAEISSVETESEPAQSAVFKELAEPKLPELAKENRARLQMQSPNKLYFYWSIKNNPYQTLNQIFGGNAGNYRLVAKLLNQTQNREEVVPVEAEGATWFDVDADSTYRTEIGFYAAHRPFVRLMFSNQVKTPRKNPSPHRDFSSDWAVSANQFAQVLDVSGYAHDAVEVALAGDDLEFADNAARNAFTQIIGSEEDDFVGNDASEIRFALLALASGYSPENLRGYISKRFFEILQENAEKLSAEKALNALQENFGEFTYETIEEEFGQTVFGASSINFPRFSKRKVLPKFAPISSFR